MRWIQAGENRAAVKILSWKHHVPHIWLGQFQTALTMNLQIKAALVQRAAQDLHNSWHRGKAIERTT